MRDAYYSSSIAFFVIIARFAHHTPPSRHRLRLHAICSIISLDVAHVLPCENVRAR